MFSRSLKLLVLIYTLKITTVQSSGAFVRTSHQDAFQIRSPLDITSIRIRGGAIDDDSEFEAYVDQLIAGVSDDGEEILKTANSKHADKIVDDVKPAAKNAKGSKRKPKRRKKKSKAAKELIDGEEKEDTDNSRGRTDSISDAKIEQKEEIIRDQVETEESKGEEEEEEKVQMFEDKKKSSEDADHRSEELNVRKSPPPNSLQRFLLSYGYIGRALAAFSLIVSEMFHRYLPEVHRLVVSFLPEPSAREAPMMRRKMEQGVHSKYAAFSSGPSVGGKKISKDQKKQMDEVALNKLKHVKGGVKSGKYAHLSTAFMKRHNLGKYADEAKMFDSIIAPLEDEEEQIENPEEVSGAEGEEEEGEEESEDWVVQAFQGHDATNGEDYEEDFLNLGFTSGGKKKSQSVIDAARESKTINTRKDTKVKGSDKDGAGGVLGRIRAVGANSGVSTRILGAYPGDAAAIEDAASKYGVVELAEKYGYGDWSDDEDESKDDSDWDHSSSKKRSKKKRRYRKSSKGKRESSRRRDGDDFSFTFDIGSSVSSSSSKSDRNSNKYRSRRSSRFSNSVTSRRNRSREKNPLGELTPDTRVRRPMERIHEINNGGRRSSRDELATRLNQRNASPSSVQAPMKRTNDLKKKLENDTE